MSRSDLDKLRKLERILVVCRETTMSLGALDVDGVPVLAGRCGDVRWAEERNTTVEAARAGRVAMFGGGDGRRSNT